jgi:hypothetical protein
MPHNIKVICLNCGHSIQLPEAATSDTIPLLLACPSCDHVYEYKLPPVVSESLRFTGFECDDSDCKFPVAVYTVLPAGIDAEAELARRRARWIFHGATCPFGHPLGTSSDDKINHYLDRSA